MFTLKITINERTASIQPGQEEYVTGSVGVDEVLFEFADTSWDGFIKKAVFQNDEGIIREGFLDSENKITVPEEILLVEGYVRIGLYGVSANEKILTTTVVKIKNKEGTPVEQGGESEYENIYAQVLANLEGLHQIVDVINNNYVPKSRSIAGHTLESNITKENLLYTLLILAKFSQEYNGLLMGTIKEGSDDLVDAESDNVVKSSGIAAALEEKVPKTRKIANLDLTEDIQSATLFNALMILATNNTTANTLLMNAIQAGADDSISENSNNVVKNRAIASSLSNMITYVNTEIQKSVPITRTIANISLNDNIAEEDLLYELITYLDTHVESIASRILKVYVQGMFIDSNFSLQSNNGIRNSTVTEALGLKANVSDLNNYVPTTRSICGLKLTDDISTLNLARKIFYGTTNPDISSALASAVRTIMLDELEDADFPVSSAVIKTYVDSQLENKQDILTYNKDINQKSMWESGVINSAGANATNLNRIRTKTYLPEFELISCEEGYEYAIVCYDSNDTVKPTNKAYYDFENDEFVSGAVYSTDEFVLADHLEALGDYTNIRLILRRTETAVMNSAESAAIHLIKTVNGVKEDNYYSESYGGGKIEDIPNPLNPIWSQWSGRLAFGKDTNTAPVPFEVNNEMLINGTIINQNTGDRNNNRWGYHLYEGYSSDHMKRLTMLIDKHDSEFYNKDSVEIYNYTGADHKEPSYGNVKLGSDVKYHSFYFSRDKMRANGVIDMGFPFQLARLGATDIDTTYATTAEADAAYEPEGQALANVKCLKGIAIQNAENGAMYYDKDNNNIKVKIDGGWKNLATEQYSIVTLTQAEYDALTTKSASTIYIITED